jgi:prepilin peptidase CpaA
MATMLAMTATALLLFAAWRDIATRTIPDAVCLGLLGLGLVVRAMEGLDALGLSLLTALGVFLFLLFLHRRGLMGGGDVKLIAALAVGLPPQGTWDLVVATALAGGVLALIYLCLRRLLRGGAPARGAGALRRLLAVEGWRIRRRGPLPYGVAIAAGGALVLLHTPGS